MAYRPAMTVTVEALGASFHMRATDRAVADLMTAAQKCGASIVDTDSIPVELVVPLADFFVAAVRGWDGVEAQDGAPLECTEENRRAIPTVDKAQVAALYLERTLVIAEKKAGPGAPPTGCGQSPDGTGG